LPNWLKALNTGHDEVSKTDLNRSQVIFEDYRH
jgi:hypothetical protein